MESAVVSSKGQITIPKKIRKVLNLEKGDRINFFIDDNIVTFVPSKSDVHELKGIVPKPSKPVSIDDINEAIKEGGSKIW